MDHERNEQKGLRKTIETTRTTDHCSKTFAHIIDEPIKSETVQLPAYRRERVIALKALGHF